MTSFFRPFRFFLWLAFLAGWTFPVLAAGTGDEGKVFANVWRLRGEVVAQAQGGKPRRLQLGSNVLVGETVRAGTDAEAVLKTLDAGMIAVRPGTEFVAERYAAEGKGNDRQFLRLIVGSLRIVSGWIGLTNRGEHKVATPTATIGIRGTDHEPYVLSAALAGAAYKPGTYDKVNRGATELEAGGGSVVVEPGQVGFARDPGNVRTRALMTLLLPVILDKVPDFYLPGSFDQEFERYAQEADRQARLALQKQHPGTRIPLATQEETPAVMPPPKETVRLQPGDSGPCAAHNIGESWLTRLDGAIARRDVKTILDLFAPEIVAIANVRSGEGMKTLRFGRDEMVQSTLASITSLKDYRQRRVSLQAEPLDATCSNLRVRSVVIEQGLMNGKPYRFESLEDYRLELRNGDWQAVSAETTQR